MDNIKNGRLQFGLFIKDGIIFFLSKFGDMGWMDAPFRVALSPDLTTLQELNEDMGYSCSIILADSLNGEVKVLRFISFSTLFSIKLKEAIEDQFVDFFDKDKYSLKLRNIMSAYTTENMVTMSLVNCKIK
ncbi:hypothetical protein NE686_17675 [Tissierella carlieri]|uniref:Uncharacterized protein n=1 Tax=Tissierella carlieri TaxID=689904 RepID=A0ABT1SEM7_9FIRM|nr:hypothetical protein [Tissierella carlieri]MCQ4924936.1 hypothetical protein [Tissierella carlieri]